MLSNKPLPFLGLPIPPPAPPPTPPDDVGVSGVSGITFNSSKPNKKFLNSLALDLALSKPLPTEPIPAPKSSIGSTSAGDIDIVDKSILGNS